MMAQAATKAEPSTVEAVVDLIRRPGAGLGLAVSREAAIALVEQYAAVVAGEAAIKATEASYAKCIAITDAALSKPLVSPHPETAVSP